MKELFKTAFRPFNRSLTTVVGGGIPGIPQLPFMSLGMNVAWINSWCGAWVFSNMMYHAATPVQERGSGAWTTEDGLIAASVATDGFKIVLANDGRDAPYGTYTILNPDGLKVKVGGWNAPAQGVGYNTSTQFEYVHTNSTGEALTLHIEGSLTANNGNLAIIIPNHLASWNSGDVWNKGFIDYYTDLKMPVLRLMDWTVASRNIESEWSHRTKPDAVTFRNWFAEGNSVPYEIMCDLAGRLGTDIWVCIPPRASSDYVQQMATLFNTHLPTGRKLWLEFANEIWNNGVPWGDGTVWVTHLDHTRRTAVYDPATTKFVLANHGIANATRISCFNSIENLKTSAAINWQFGNGCGIYVKVIDANSFEVYSEVGLTTKIVPHVETKNLLFIVESEAGKVSNMNEHFGEICIRNWDIFDAMMGMSKVHHLVSAMSYIPSTTSGRLAVPGVASRADGVAIAPYYDGTWFGSAVTCGSGTLTPKFWASNSYPVHMAIYPSGATPTANQVIAGTGAINKQLLNYSADSGAYTSGTTVSSLTNGTEYKVVFVYVDNVGSWMHSVNATPSATITTVYGYDSHANQGIRNRLNIVKSVGQVMDHVAAAGSIPVVCYEGGLHYHHSKPSQVGDWLNEYQESSTFADVTKRYLDEMSAAGAKLLCYYGDSLDTPFAISNGFHDIADLRYVTFKNKGGKAIKQIQPSFVGGLADSLLTQPTFPHSWLYVGDPTYDYTFISGNDNGNYTIVDGYLTIVNDVGINWGAPVLNTLKIVASNASFTRAFEVLFSTGDAWYEADATFAWNSITDADATQINPEIGSAMTLANGTGAVISDGMWQFDGATRYYSATATKAVISTANGPILWAAVMDATGVSSWYKTIWHHGAGNFMATYFGEPTKFYPRANVSGANVPVIYYADGAPTGKNVYWCLYDPATSLMHAGKNQVSNGSILHDFGPISLFTQALHIGGPSGSAQSLIKHGSMQIVSRAGLTMTDVLGIVAKMQNLHGIA